MFDNKHNKLARFDAETRGQLKPSKVLRVALLKYLENTFDTQEKRENFNYEGSQVKMVIPNEQQINLQSVTQPFTDNHNIVDMEFTTEGALQATKEFMKGGNLPVVSHQLTTFVADETPVPSQPAPPEVNVEAPPDAPVSPELQDNIAEELEKAAPKARGDEEDEDGENEDEQSAIGNASQVDLCSIADSTTELCGGSAVSEDTAADILAVSKEEEEEAPPGEMSTPVGSRGQTSQVNAATFSNNTQPAAIADHDAAAVTCPIDEDQELELEHPADLPKLMAKMAPHIQTQLFKALRDMLPELVEQASRDADAAAVAAKADKAESSAGSKSGSPKRWSVIPRTMVRQQFTQCNFNFIQLAQMQGSSSTDRNQVQGPAQMNTPPTKDVSPGKTQSFLPIDARCQMQGYPQVDDSTPEKNVSPGEVQGCVQMNSTPTKNASPSKIQGYSQIDSNQKQAYAQVGKHGGFVQQRIDGIQQQGYYARMANHQRQGSASMDNTQVQGSTQLNSTLTKNVSPGKMHGYAQNPNQGYTQVGKYGLVQQRVDGIQKQPYSQSDGIQKQGYTQVDDSTPTKNVSPGRMQGCVQINSTPTKNVSPGRMQGCVQINSTPTKNVSPGRMQGCVQINSTPTKNVSPGRIQGYSQIDISQKQGHTQVGKHGGFVQQVHPSADTATTGTSTSTNTTISTTISSTGASGGDSGSAADVDGSADMVTSTVSDGDTAIQVATSTAGADADNDGNADGDDNAVDDGDDSDNADEGEDDDDDDADDTPLRLAIEHIGSVKELKNQMVKFIASKRPTADYISVHQHMSTKNITFDTKTQPGTTLVSFLHDNKEEDRKNVS